MATIKKKIQSFSTKGANQTFTTQPANTLRDFFVILAVLLCGSTWAAERVTVTIFDAPYDVILEENNKLIPQADRDSTAVHYQGRLADYEDSWVRLSSIGGQWQGVVSFAGTTYLVGADSAISSENVLPGSKQQAEFSQNPTIKARQLASFPAQTCGHKDHLHSSNLEKQSATLSPTAHSATVLPEQVAFGTLCDSSNIINGVCLLAELEMAFDQEFQQSFSDPQGQALALINIVEGFYRNDFNIAFDTLTLEMLTNDILSPAVINSDGELVTTASPDILEDLSAKRLSGQLNFLQNNRSLFHFVTGREIEGTTAGIAFTGTLCDDFAIGVSELLFNIPLTAVVVAHELGHNFGSGHDGEGAGASCPSSGFIMAPSISSGFDEFSNCSINQIQSHISSINIPQLCFNFPADLSITASANNQDTAEANQTFILEYQINRVSGFEAIPSLQVTGSILTTEGQINSATLNGLDCPVTGSSYSCSFLNPLPQMVLEIQAQGNSGTASFTHQVSTNNANIVDTNTSNNQIQTELTITAATTPPPPTTPPSPGTTSGSSGGGGGSIGWPLLSLLALMAWLRHRYSLIEKSYEITL